LYLKDILLPEYTDADGIYRRAVKVVSRKWKLYVLFYRKELLYNDELSSRFIDPAPFSKFYLEIDVMNLLGQVGVDRWQIKAQSIWIIMKSTVQQLLDMDARELFEKSKW
jgi:hypothetical protein